MLVADDVESNRDFLKRLESHYLEEWNHFKTTQSIKSVRAFAKNLKILAERFDIALVSDYGERLLSHANNFDVKNMRTTIFEFPTLIETLRSVHEKGKTI